MPQSHCRQFHCTECIFSCTRFKIKRIQGKLLKDVIINFLKSSNTVKEQRAGEEGAKNVLIKLKYR